MGATPEQLKQLQANGTLDKWLADGKIDQAKYDSAMQRVQAINMGVPDAAGQPPSMAQAPMNAGQVAAAYKTPVEYVRPSAHIPGIGDAPVKDGSWWDSAKKAMPQSVRDAVLGIEETILPYGADDMARSIGGTFTLPSRGPVWLEPSDAEAENALRQEQALDGLEVPITTEHIKRWKDKKWADAYDNSKKRGVPMYRGRDIDDESPHFMKVAKRAAEYAGPVEAAARKFDESYTFGKLGASVDTGDWGSFQREQMRGTYEKMGVPPPGYLGTLEEDQEAARMNIERGQRTVEASPVAAFTGGAAGALAPGGGPTRIAEGVGKLVKPLLSGRGIVSGAVKSGLEAGVGGAAEQLSLNATNRMRNEFAGLPEGDITEGVVMSGGLSAAVGTVLGVPGGMSRGMREAGDEISSAHKELGDSTQFFSESGVRPPAGHEEMLEKYGTQGTYAGARSEAANAAADVMGRRAEQTSWQLHDTADQLTDDLDSMSIGVQSDAEHLASEIVFRGEKDDIGLEVSTRSFTKKLMDRIDTELTGGRQRMHAETEAALDAEGAPPYSDVPGPDMSFEDIDLARKAANENDLGLETEYPSISVDRVIDKHHEIMQKLAFHDGSPMASTTHAKMKAAADLMYVKKIVSEEESPLYDGVGHSFKTLEDGNVEILLPRLVSARELNDIIRHFDEMAKYASNSMDPRAADYKQLGAIARDLREESFQVLAGTKLQHHQQIRENEEMLTALGLPSNVNEVDPTSVTQVATIMERIKTMAKQREYSTPEGLNVPQVAFENWLVKYDDDLFRDYMNLKGLARKQREVHDFNIMADATPRHRSESFKKVRDAILGERTDADAIMKTFSSVTEQVRSLRARKRQVDDVFTLFGVNSTMGGMNPKERDGMRMKFNQIMVDGGMEFDSIRKRMKPEQQQMLDVSKQAAGDTDEMFRTLGFGPTHNKPGFQSAEREEIVGGLHGMFDNYKRYGKSVDFDRSVEKLFKDNPNVKTALTRMSKTRAFQLLRGEAEGAAMPMVGLAKPRTWLVSAKDFFRNHIDAMVSRKKGSKALFDVPAPWAVGLTQQSGQPQDEEGESLSSISSVAALEALIRAVSKIESEESAK